MLELNTDDIYGYKYYVQYFRLRHKAQNLDTLENL